ncbi:MAG TPA: hypothetical protein VF194_18105 [Ferrovibrio sp.]|uniref:hypothetical protein n=1 Tax=Ferrovibrio sp. TaxID=1917215 RepID=UPI002ED2F3D5
MMPGRAIAILVAAAGLAACAGEAGNMQPGDFDLTRNTRESPTWAAHLPQVYGGLMACIGASPAQPAFATDVVPQNHGRLLVQLHGGDGGLSECSTDSAGRTAPSLKPLDAATAPAPDGPMFTPAGMSEPLLRCGRNEPVFHKNGRLLGWVTFFRADCQSAAAPAAQSRWHAFGSDPYWSIRIDPDGVVFDQVGTLPLEYRAAAPTESGNRRHWQLSPPPGDERKPLELTILSERCRDAVSNSTYDYSAEAVYAGKRFRGCAEKLDALP